nr:hypothetical protein [Tanacetum cinerariifolium]
SNWQYNGLSFRRSLDVWFQDFQHEATAPQKFMVLKAP